MKSTFKKFSYTTPPKDLYLASARNGSMALLDKLSTEWKLQKRKIDRFEEKVSPYLPTEIIANMFTKKKEPEIRENDFVMDWTLVLGWKSNPFVDKVLEPGVDFFAADKKMKLLVNSFFIHGYDFGTVIGEDGAGKTVVLRWIAGELERHKTIMIPCYVNGAANINNEAALIKAIIQPLTSLYEKSVVKPEFQINARNIEQFILQKVGTRKFILMIDNIDKLPEQYYPVLTRIRNSSIKLQLIVSVTKEIPAPFNGAEYKDNLKIRLRDMHYDLAEDMIKRRIEHQGGHGIFPFTTAQLQKLFDRAQHNPRKFLKLCNGLAIHIALVQKDKILQMRREMEERRRLEEEQQRQSEEERLDNEEKRRTSDAAYLEKQEQAQSQTSDAVPPKDETTDKIDSLIEQEIKKAVVTDKKSKEGSDEELLKKNDDFLRELASDVNEKDLKKEEKRRDSQKEEKEPDPDFLSELGSVLPDMETEEKKGSEKESKGSKPKDEEIPDLTGDLPVDTKNTAPSKDDKKARKEEKKRAKKKEEKKKKERLKKKRHQD